VAFFDVDSSVATSTFPVWYKDTEDGRPLRSPSIRPSRRRSKNRARHLPTVFSDAPTKAAACLFIAPVFAQANTIRTRSARACEEVAWRARRPNWSRSTTARVESVMGHSVRSILLGYTFGANFRSRTPAHTKNAEWARLVAEFRG